MTRRTPTRCISTSARSAQAEWFLWHHEAVSIGARGRGNRRTVFDAVEGLLDGRPLRRAAPQAVVDEISYVLWALVWHLHQCKGFRVVSSPQQDNLMLNVSDDNWDGVIFRQGTLATQHVNTGPAWLIVWRSFGTHLCVV